MAVDILRLVVTVIPDYSSGHFTLAVQLTNKNLPVQTISCPKQIELLITLPENL